MQSNKVRRGLPPDTIGAGRGRRIPFVLALLPALRGCLHPEVSNPALDLPAAYRAARGKSHAALPKLDWWRGFRSRELTALMEEAQVANLDIAAAVARVVQADAQSRIIGAALLPTFDYDGSATRARSPGGRDTAVLRSAISASYEIDFWGKNRSLLRGSEFLAAASRYDREVVALTVLAAVATQYFLLLSSQDRLRLAQDNLRSATRVYNVIKERLDVGTASQLDIAQQESVVATQRAAIPVLEQLVQQNRNLVAVLVGRAPEQINIRGGTM